MYGTVAIWHLPIKQYPSISLVPSNGTLDSYNTPLPIIGMHDARECLLQVDANHVINHEKTFPSIYFHLSIHLLQVDARECLLSNFVVYTVSSDNGNEEAVECNGGYYIDRCQGQWPRKRAQINTQNCLQLLFFIFNI